MEDDKLEVKKEGSENKVKSEPVFKPKPFTDHSEHKVASLTQWIEVTY